MSKDTGASKNNKRPVEGWTCKSCGTVNGTVMGTCAGTVMGTCAGTLHTRLLSPKGSGGGMRTRMTHAPCGAAR